MTEWTMSDVSPANRVLFSGDVCLVSSLVMTSESVLWRFRRRMLGL